MDSKGKQKPSIQTLKSFNNILTLYP